jgi:prepilin-type N-terminal cleavage/methylation domain-containing protein
MTTRTNRQKGFTLIETLIAIFLLTLTVGGLLELAAGGYYSVRYARNQLVADTMLQESLEYMHNSRDTNLQQGGTWQAWTQGFTACNSSTGCIVDPYTTGPKVTACRDLTSTGECPAISFYPNAGFYGYVGANYPAMNGQSFDTPTATSYVRTITMQPYGADQLQVTSTVQWMNGSVRKSASQSILLTNWQ